MRLQHNKIGVFKITKGFKDFPIGKIKSSLKEAKKHEVCSSEVFTGLYEEKDWNALIDQMEVIVEKCVKVFDTENKERNSHLLLMAIQS